MLLVLTLTPAAIYRSPGFDGVAAAAALRRQAPGNADRTEPDSPGFHATDTLDYVIVLAGELWLVVDHEEALLLPGETVVQIGARHA